MSSQKTASLTLFSRWVFKLWLRRGHKESQVVWHCFLTDNKGGCLRFLKEVWPLFKSNHRYLYNNKLSSLHPGILSTLKSLELLWVVVSFFFFCFFVFVFSVNYGNRSLKFVSQRLLFEIEWPNLSKCTIRVLPLYIFTDLIV